MRAFCTSLLVFSLSACAAFGQDFEQVNTSSPQVVSNKTLLSTVLTSPAISAPTLSGTVTGTYTLSGSPSLVAAVLSGTMTGTYTLGGTPTIMAPILSGSVTGTYTLAGSPTIAAPIFSGTITGTYTLGGTPTINSPTITGAALFGSTIRLPNNTYYLGRNAANAADVSLAKINASDQIEFGTTVKNFSLDANPTTALQATTKQYVDAGNSATLLSAQKNPIINGSMEIWQRGASFATVATGTYTADRWKWVQSGAGAVTINRSTNVPSVASAGVLFNYSIEVDVTTADASIGATDFYYLAQPIEGYNWRHFAQRDVIISFWVMSSKTGAHSVALNNTGRNRAATANYTINAADTWEYKSVSFGASPSAGTWDYTTGEGVILSFAVAVGSDAFNTGGSGAWETSTAWHGAFGAGPVNAMDSAANFFRLTGVKLELGTTATPIQFIPFEEELARCQRYYQKSFPYATAPAQNATKVGALLYTPHSAGATTNYSNSVPFQVEFRAVPTLTLFNPDAANAQIRNVSLSTDFTSSGGDTNYMSQKSFVVQGIGSASLALTNILAVHWTADAEL